MSFFFTVVVFGEDGDVVDRQVHGPFSSEDDRDEAIESIESDYDEVAICPVNALVSDDEVNLLVDEYV